MKTLSPEMDAWLERQHAKQPEPAPTKAAPQVPITDDEFAWLWPRFQKCRFGTISAATKFARTPLDRVTPRGKVFALRMAFRHRTQIFGRSARKLAHDEFLSEIRTAAAKASR